MPSDIGRGGGNGRASEENGARQEEERGDKIIEATVKQGLPQLDCLLPPFNQNSRLGGKTRTEARNHASGNEESSVDPLFDVLIQRPCLTLRLNRVDRALGSDGTKWGGKEAREYVHHS